MATRVFEDAKEGDLVMVLRNGEFVIGAKIHGVSSTTIKIGADTRYPTYFQTYSRGTGIRRNESGVNGNEWRAVPATQEEIDAARAAKEAKDREDRERRDREEEAKRQAEYDALPEEAKLALKLKGFFDYGATEKQVSKMPLDILRAAVKWIEENGHECE